MFRIVFCPVFSSVVGLIKIKLKRCVGELDDSTLRNLKVRGPDAGREEEQGMVLRRRVMELHPHSGETRPFLSWFV